MLLLNQRQWMILLVMLVKILINISAWCIKKEILFC